MSGYLIFASLIKWLFRDHAVIKAGVFDGKKGIEHRIQSAEFVIYNSSKIILRNRVIWWYTYWPEQKCLLQ